LAPVSLALEERSLKTKVHTASLEKTTVTDLTFCSRVQSSS